MIPLKTKEDIEKIRASALLVSKTLALIAAELKEGVTLKYLDLKAEDFILSHGAKPVFKGYNGFPASLCISVNEQVVHGIPGSYQVKDDDLISVDCGVIKDGFVGDHAYTFCMGAVGPATQKLVRITKECLYLGIEMVNVQNRIGDISYTIQNHAEKNGFSIVRELVGHGVGRALHEPPNVPNYGKRGSGPKIQEGLTIAIEPMINLGKKNIKSLKDGWTIVAADGKPSAHFEHNVAVIDGKAEILSTFEFVEAELKKNNNLLEI